MEVKCIFLGCTRIGKEQKIVWVPYGFQFQCKQLYAAGPRGGAQRTGNVHGLAVWCVWTAAKQSLCANVSHQGANPNVGE